MIIKTAEFVSSSAELRSCPKPTLPEYAFIGRSNVGKSSIINMICNKKGLAKISSTPGKTQIINHFIINKKWYLVDLPGYGYAKRSKSKIEAWNKLINNYISKRDNLVNLFVLIDSRLDPQKNDLDFMQKLGEAGIPFVIVFTKADKISVNLVNSNINKLKQELLKTWESMPQYFITSAVSKKGRDEILNFIDEYNNKFMAESQNQ
jgi:GTP-binding protein